MIKKIFCAFILSTACASASYAACTPGTNWTVAWTDNYNQTTYTLNAPCKVYIGIPFSYTATVTDAVYPNGWVAHSWAIKDNGAVVSGGGFNQLWLSGGQWQKVIQQTYSGSPIDHMLEFKFTDMGRGGGAHNWAYSIIGHITLDPYPDATNALPVVNAGADIVIASQDQAATTLNGQSTDADGDPLSYRWLEGGVELQPSQPISGTGDAPLSLATVPLLSVGTHTLTLEVTDGKDTVTDEVWVSIENTPPAVVAVGSGTFQIGEDIPLNGSVADYDGDGLAYKWLAGSALLASGTIATNAGGSPVSLPTSVIAGGLPKGAHLLVLEVTDGIHVVTATITIQVIDTVAPSLSPSASTYILWPQHHQMVDVVIQANATDNSSGSVTLVAMVTSNEPPEYDKQGNIIPDYYVLALDQQNGLLNLQLRAARLGNGNGRIYTIAITATDESGNASTAEVQIQVPHDSQGNIYSKPTKAKTSLKAPRR